MDAPRSKAVTVGGREFVVRPLLGRVARELQHLKREDNVGELAATVAAVLKRTAPDVTEEWLLENGDMAEYGEVMQALAEVSGGKKSPGEVPAP